MCYRYTLLTSPKAVADLFRLDDLPLFSPRANISLTQPIGAVRLGHESQKREWVLLHWGLIPSWAKDAKAGRTLGNARSETAASKPSFRGAFRRRRCLIAADGFYEWLTTNAGKKPYRFHMSDERPFAFAGLWEYWEGGDGEVIESGTILTTSANEVVQPFHDRMPVILDSVHFERWLNTEGNPASEVQELLVPYAGTDLVANAVDGPIREVKSKPSDVQGHFAWET